MTPLTSIPEKSMVSLTIAENGLGFATVTMVTRETDCCPFFWCVSGNAFNNPMKNK